MKQKQVLSMIAALLGISVCIGVYKKPTYTDISQDDSYLESIYVAEIPENYAVSASEELSEKLPQMPVIAKVTAVGAAEHLAGASRQMVRVKTVYKGEGLEEGQLIYLTCDRWSLSLFGEPHSIERGFVNILNTGEDYLIFADEQVDGLGEKMPIYSLYDESVIAPVFSFEERSSVIVDVTGLSTYVPYYQVRENEFFAESQEALNAMETLKEKMLEIYE